MTSYWLDTHPITERGVPFEPDQRYDTVVVGAGLTGVTTALLLAQLGQRVALLEARSKSVHFARIDDLNTAIDDPENEMRAWVVAMK